VRAKRFQLAFSFARCLACFVQDTDVRITPRRDNNDRGRAKNGATDALPHRQTGARELIANGKANPQSSRPEMQDRWPEAKFRHANYIPQLAPSLSTSRRAFGHDTAPNPSEASLRRWIMPCGRAPRQCGASRMDRQQARASARGDLNITAVWGTGDVSEKPSASPTCGSRSTWNARASRRANRRAVTHVKKWSPVPTRSHDRSILRSARRDRARAVVAIVAYKPVRRICGSVLYRVSRWTRNRFPRPRSPIRLRRLRAKTSRAGG